MTSGLYWSFEFWDRQKAEIIMLKLPQELSPQDQKMCFLNGWKAFDPETATWLMCAWWGQSRVRRYTVFSEDGTYFMLMALDDQKAVKLANRMMSRGALEVEVCKERSGLLSLGGSLIRPLGRKIKSR